MTWPADQLNRIASSEELQITTTRPDGTQRQWTPIWVVRVADGLYIRSAGGRTSGWYRHATQRNSARVRADGIETDVTLQPVANPALNAQVTAAYQAKYGNQSNWLAPFLVAPGIEATLRLDRPGT
jgi:hypothetical protein